jgi:glycosyltransferase involved in cell wall biosynthesis
VRVLWLSVGCPTPPNGGNRLRILNLLKSVASRHEVAFVCSSWEEEDEPDQLREICAQVGLTSADPLPAARTDAVQRLVPRDAGRPGSYVPARIANYAAIAAELSERPFDVAVTALGVAPALPAARPRRTLLQEHNIEEELWLRMWRAKPPGERKLAELRHWLALRRLERGWMRRVDAITVCSERERRLLERRPRRLPPVHVVPNGADVDTERFSAEPRDPDLLLVAGVMSWPPNFEGARALIERVMPQVWARRPRVRLVVAGKDPPEWLQALAGPRLEVTGVLPDLAPLRRLAALEVVPLLTGGGTRHKILQAMASGLPVVSTPMGAEGLDVRPDDEIVIVDLAQMAPAILELLDRPERRATLARAARARVEADYDWRLIGERFTGILEGLAAS